MYGDGVMPGRWAGSGVDKHNAESPEQGSKRFNSITKTIHFAHLGILFIYGHERAFVAFITNTIAKFIEVQRYLHRLALSRNPCAATIEYFFEYILRIFKETTAGKKEFRP